MRDAVQVLDGIVGWVTDEAVAGQLHELRHHRAVEYLHLSVHDLDRRRMRVTSDAGVDYALMLPRDATLADGAVLLLESTRAVVVRAGAPQVLTLQAVNVAAALRLGFLAGHLHWKIDQRGDIITVHVEGEVSDYLARVRDLLDSGQVRRA